MPAGEVKDLRGPGQLVQCYALIVMVEWQEKELHTTTPVARNTVSAMTMRISRFLDRPDFCFAGHYRVFRAHLAYDIHVIQEGEGADFSFFFPQHATGCIPP